MVNAEELDCLEQDLNAVAGRLGSRRSWEEFGPRVRRALHRPTRELVGTTGLMLVCVGAGFWAPSAWMVAGGLLLAVLPGRVRGFRDRRRALAAVSEGDLFALCRRELELKLAHHFTQALLDVALALLFGLVGVLAPDSRPGLMVAAVLAVSAGVHVFWCFPRAYRGLRDFDEGEVAP
ncbi:MAG: hypothetical protein GY711_14210 [bacterium]|nr:hypothetical protein [bacterium]